MGLARGHWKRIVMMGGAILSTLGVAQWSRHVAERSMIQALSDRGYPTTYAELDHWYPSVPDADNAAMVFLEARPFVTRVSSGASLWMVPELGEAWSPDHRERAVELIEANPRLFATLPKLTGKDGSRFPVDLSVAMKGSTHLNEFKFAAQLTLGDGLLAVESGDVNRTIQRVADLGRLASLLRNEPTSSAVWATCGIVGMQTTLGERAMSSLELSADVLDRIEMAMGSVDLIRMYRRSLIGSLAYYLDLGESGLYPTRARFARYTGERSRHIRWALDRVASVSFDDGRMDRLAETLEEWTAPRTPIYHGLNRKMGQYEAKEKFLAKVASTLARRNAWELALALERYRIAQDALPSSLEALVPGFVAANPIDPFSGDGMRYRVGPVEYRIYSVGEDGVDDGGITRPAKGRRDIVFRVMR